MTNTPARRPPEFVPEDRRGDQALEFATWVTSVVPWLGSPVSAILSSKAFDRKMDRVRDVLNGVVADVYELRSDVSEEYVRTDAFEELFEAALRRAAEERNPSRRAVYRNFIVNAIREPGPYDDRMRALRLLEQLEPDHIAVLSAFAADPGAIDDGAFGSPSTTLSQRLNERLPRECLEPIVADLNQHHLTNLRGLHTTMTARGAKDLRSCVTPLGRAVLALIRSS